MTKIGLHITTYNRILFIILFTILLMILLYISPAFGESEFKEVVIDGQTIMFEPRKVQGIKVIGEIVKIDLNDKTGKLTLKAFEISDSKFAIPVNIVKRLDGELVLIKPKSNTFRFIIPLKEPKLCWVVETETEILVYDAVTNKEIGYGILPPGSAYVEPLGSCGGKTPCYPTIQSAIDSISSGTTIKINSGEYIEKVNVNSDKNLTFEGGSKTKLRTMTFKKGRSVINKLILADIRYSKGITICGEDRYWRRWSESAQKYFFRWGYIPTEFFSEPQKPFLVDKIIDSDIKIFYELAHGNSDYFVISGSPSYLIYAGPIIEWMSERERMLFTFLGSCHGMCRTTNALASAFNKNDTETAAVVGYCGMSENVCRNCWSVSIDWQEAFFEYIDQGFDTTLAFNKSLQDYPQCKSCVRIVGCVEKLKRN